MTPVPTGRPLHAWYTGGPFFCSNISETGTSLCPVHSGVMRRYHFHIVDGVRVFDSLGTTLPDDEAARAHAQKVVDYFAR